MDFIYNVTTALLAYVVLLMIIRYVFLEKGLEAPKDGIFHLVAIGVCLFLCILGWGDAVSLFTGLAGFIYLYKCCDTGKRFRHAMLIFPALGIVDGLVLPFVIMPTSLMEISEKADSIYQEISSLVLLVILGVFFIVGKNWRKNYREQLGERRLRKYEYILICVIGCLLLLFSTALQVVKIYNNNDLVSEIGNAEIADAVMDGFFNFIMFIYSISSFIMTATVIVLVMVQNKQAYYHDRVRDMQFNIIVMMAEIVENRDKNTGGHIKRTAKYVEIIAKRLQKDGLFSDIINDNYIKNLAVAAPLHDIGKIHVSDVVLNKPGRLTDEEFVQMKTHAAEGKTLLTHAKSHLGDFQYLDMAIEVAGYHHEWWDGSAKGYPEGLKGEDIPLSARIMAVADVFDALTSRRVYKDPMPVEKAFGIIRQEEGTHFDPVITQAFFKASDEIMEWLEIFLNDDSETDCLADADHIHEHMAGEHHH